LGKEKNPEPRYCEITIQADMLNGYSTALETAVKAAVCLGNTTDSVLRSAEMGPLERILIDASTQAGDHLSMSMVGGLVQERIAFSVSWKKEVLIVHGDEEKDGRVESQPMPDTH